MGEMSAHEAPSPVQLGTVERELCNARLRHQSDEGIAVHKHVQLYCNTYVQYIIHATTPL